MTLTARRPVEVSGFLANLFNLRWALGRFGWAPCDEWSIDDLLGLPEGLSYRDGAISFQCNVCEAWTEWPAEPEDFDIGAHENMCGRSPRCIP